MTAITILMAALLAAAAWQDFKTQLVTDWLTIPFCGLGIIAAVLRGDFLSALIAAILVLAVIFMPESGRGPQNACIWGERSRSEMSELLSLRESERYEACGDVGGADLIVLAGFAAFFGLVKLPDLLILVCLLSLVIFAAERILKINFITKNGGIALLVPAFFIFILGVILR